MTFLPSEKGRIDFLRFVFSGRKVNNDLLTVMVFIHQKYCGAKRWGGQDTTLSSSIG